VNSHQRISRYADPLWGRGSLNIPIAFNPVDTTKKYESGHPQNITQQVSDFTIVDV
jgi:hypothetical protein